MAEVEITMPKMGESIMEATVLSWLKKPGDRVEEDESLLEVATDKVDTEIPSMYAGVLKEILAAEGEVVKIGSPIAIVVTEGDVPTPSTNGNGHAQVEQKARVHVAELSGHGTKTAPSFKGASRFYSPLVKSIARNENIPVTELETIHGSGKEGRVTKKDILAYVTERHTGQTSLNLDAPSPLTSTPVTLGDSDEIIEMDRMRKMIAQRMVESKRIAPHVTSFVEADVTNIVMWRSRVRHEFQEKFDEGLTYTPIFLQAVARAIVDYPMVNIQVDGDRIIRKKDINLGLAVALPTGNLIVPVIRNADKLTLVQMARTVNDLSRRARENKLKPDEVTGGTFTVSNVGSFGNVMGTPIILQPQVAIIALGAVQKKPAVVETPTGDAIAIRHKMFLSHSYDHRVVDGALGGMLVKRVADYLERFDPKQDLG